MSSYHLEIASWLGMGDSVPNPFLKLGPHRLEPVQALCTLP